MHAYANALMFYKLLAKVITKDCCQQRGDDDSDDDDRFDLDDKTTAVTDDDHDDSDASFVCVSVRVSDFFSSSSDWIPE